MSYCRNCGHQTKETNQACAKCGLLQQTSTLPSISDLDSNKKDEKNTFFIALAIYTIIVYSGIFEPIFGMVLLGIYCFVAIFKVIARNLPIIIFMVVVGVICTVIPFLMPIYIILLICLLLGRLGFFFQNFGIVALGLAMYFVPLSGMVINLAGSQHHYYRQASPDITGILLILVSPVILYIGLKVSQSKGYTVKRGLEIMSEAPLLIISFLLPFIKIDMGHGIGLDGNHNVGGSEVTHVGNGVATETVVTTTPQVTNVGGTSMIADAIPISSNALPHVGMAPVANNLGMPTALTHHIGNTTTTVTDNLGMPVASIHQVGGDATITDSLGMPKAFAHHSGNTTTITDNLGTPIASIHQAGNAATITDNLGMPVASIHQAGNTSTITDSLGMPIGSLHQAGNTVLATDGLGAPTGFMHANSTVMPESIGLQNSPITHVSTQPFLNNLDTHGDSLIHADNPSSNLSVTNPSLEGLHASTVTATPFSANNLADVTPYPVSMGHQNLIGNTVAENVALSAAKTNAESTNQSKPSKGAFFSFVVGFGGVVIVGVGLNFAVNYKSIFGYSQPENTGLGGLNQNGQQFSQVAYAGDDSAKNLSEPESENSTDLYNMSIEDLEVRAQQGDSEAQHTLGDRFNLPTNLPANNIKAAQWYSQAAQQGNMAAKESLEAMYNQGRAIPE